MLSPVDKDVIVSRWKATLILTDDDQIMRSTAKQRVIDLAIKLGASNEEISDILKQIDSS